MEKPSCSGSNNSLRGQDILQANESSSGRKLLYCNYCGKIFNKKSCLIAHMRIHTGEKPFTCRDCQKSFTIKSNLITHQRTHTGEKPFSCSDCEMSFSLKSSLITHQRTHTGDKPFTCSDCEMSFGQKSHLIKHQRTHTGDRPFTCSDCEMSFVQKSHLITHQRTHTGDKPFTCSDCEMSFSLKSSLITHQRTHTGEKPFTCSCCGKCFSTKSSLKRHQRVYCGKRTSSGNENFAKDDVQSYTTSHLETIGNDLHDGLSVKDEIDIEEISFESEVGELYDVKDIMVKNEVDLYPCKHCREGLKGSEFSHVCQFISGNWDDNAKDVTHLENSEKDLSKRLSVKEEIDIDEIPFESQVSKEF